MSNLTRLIIIWGAAILLYLLISNQKGSVAVLNSFSDFVVGTTRTLQGRNIQR